MDTLSIHTSWNYNKTSKNDGNTGTFQNEIGHSEINNEFAGNEFDQTEAEFGILATLEQWIRINTAMSVMACLLLINAIFFALVVHFRMPPSKPDITIRYYNKQVIGMPIPKLAMVSKHGYIKEFPMNNTSSPNELENLLESGKELEYFPKLQSMTAPCFYGSSGCQTYLIFGSFHDNYNYYFHTSPDKNVVKHKMDTPSFFHREIPNSHIPNKHVNLPYQVYGIRIGLHFWILGGVQFPWDDSFEKFNPDTSLWSFVKEQWVQGPTLPSNVRDLLRQGPRNICIQALNSKSVIFLGVGPGDQILDYNFDLNNWSVRENEFIPNALVAATCVAGFDKSSNL